MRRNTMKGDLHLICNVTKGDFTNKLCKIFPYATVNSFTCIYLCDVTIRCLIIEILVAGSNGVSADFS